MFDEMRTFAGENTGVSSADIVRMATENGAAGLGLQRKIGVLSTDAFADMITLPYEGKHTESYDAVVQHSGPVAASMIDGQWAMYPNG
jgi:cytosine/adenosine deaminase-related metal-dependent hydrolase